MCVCVTGETANGKFPDQAVATMAAIVRNAENTSCYNATMAFIRWGGGTHTRAHTHGTHGSKYSAT